MSSFRRSIPWKLVQRSTYHIVTQMMKDVYAQAESVIAWLGPARESDAAAISLLKQVVVAIELPEDDESSSYQHIDYQSLGIPTPAKTEWTDLSDLLFHPYFYRIQIIQEVITNRHSIFRCGLRLIERDDMLKVRAILNKYKNIRDALTVSLRRKSSPQALNISQL